MKLTTAKTLLATICTPLLLSLAALPAHAGKTVDAIKARGQLICGVNTGLAGFSAADSQGNWSGLDVDVCKAIAAAMLGDASKVKYVPLNAQQRFHRAAVRRDRHPVAQHHLDPGPRCGAGPGLSPVTMFIRRTGLSLCTSASGKIKSSAKQLNGADRSVCRRARRRKRTWPSSARAHQPGQFKTLMFENLRSGRLKRLSSAAAARLSRLMLRRLASPYAQQRFQASRKSYVVLPDRISARSRWGRSVRRGDEDWSTPSCKLDWSLP